MEQSEKHHHATGYNLSRREFLQRMTFFAIGMVLPPRKIYPFPQREENGREQQGINWPEDLRGNEDFLRGNIFITIDDCQFTPHLRSMFETLKENHATATFFPNTVYQRTDEVYMLWKDIYAAGNDIGYHTTNHDFGSGSSTSNWSIEQLKEDFDRFTQTMREILKNPSYTPRFVRPPFGAWNQKWMTFVRERGLTNVRWNFVPNAKNNSLKYFDVVMKHPQGGRIILLHTRQWDVEWLQRNIVDLQTLAAQYNGKLISFRNL